MGDDLYGRHWLDTITRVLIGNTGKRAWPLRYGDSDENTNKYKFPRNRSSNVHIPSGISFIHPASEFPSRLSLIPLFPLLARSRSR